MTQVWGRVTTRHTRTPLTLNRPHLASLQLIRERQLAYMPRASVGVDVASHPSGRLHRRRCSQAIANWLHSHADHIAREASLPLADSANWGLARHRTIPRQLQLVPLNSREQSWRLARCGRFRFNRVRVWRVVTLPQTWVVIFFLRGGFLTTPESAGSMAQRDNRLPLWVLDAPPRIAALWAVARCSQVPRWGQTK
jgi:hypothetical protein